MQDDDADFRVVGGPAMEQINQIGRKPAILARGSQFIMRLPKGSGCSALEHYRYLGRYIDT